MPKFPVADDKLQTEQPPPIKADLPKNEEAKVKFACFTYLLNFSRRKNATRKTRRKNVIRVTRRVESASMMRFLTPYLRFLNLP